MSSTIVQTGFLAPQTIISNGAITSNPWTQQDNVFLLDGDVAQSDPSTGSASDLMVGNFNFNIPQGAVIVGIEIALYGYRGAQTSPVITISPNAVDNTSGSDVIYTYTAPYTGLTQNNEEHILGGQNYLFGTTWDADKINNLKLDLLANGDVYIDLVKVNVIYYVPATPGPAAPVGDHCEDCNSQVQAQPFYLALPMQATDTVFYLKSFNYPNGTPILYTDLGDCGGAIDFVFDQGKPKEQGSDFEENAKVAVWETLPSGIVKFTLGSINDRGLMFHTPFTHDANLLSGHAVNSEVVISNSGSFYDRFLKKCHVGVLVSDIITVKDEGNQVATPVTKFNFIGDSIQAVQNDVDPEQVDISVINNPTNIEPTVEDTSEGTTGTTPATSLTISHTITSANYLRVWISTDDETISSVEYDGVAMTLIASETNAPADLKVALYDLINPNVGANDIIVTMAGASNITAGGVSFLDVDTSNPTDGISSGAIGTSTAPSDSVTTTTVNTVVQDVVGGVTNATTFTQSYPWTIQAQVNVADRTGASSTTKVLSPATVTDTYTIGPSQTWAIILAGVRGAVNTNLGVLSVTGLDTDNTDPQNPVVQIAVDGTSITGDGTPGNPLVATGGGGGSGEVVQKTITQTAHGFSIGDVLKSSGVDGEFALAEADVVTNADAIGIVTSVPTVNTFVLTTEGFAVISVLPGGAVAGDNLFLSDSVAGALTLTDPAIANVPGTVSFPLGTVIDASSGLCNIHKYRPQEQQSTPLGSAAFTVNADETDIEWFTTEIALPSGSSPSVNGWTYGNTPTAVMNGVSASFSPSGSMCSTNGVQDLFLGSTSSLLTYALARTYRIKFLAKTTSNGTPVAGNNCFIGFGSGSSATNYGDIAVATEYRIGFAFYDDGDVYTVSSDFSAITANSQGAFTSSVHEYVIEVENGVSAKFYIDGVLVDTITTDLPASQPIAISIGGQSASSSGFNFVSNFILSQKLS